MSSRRPDYLAEKLPGPYPETFAEPVPATIALPPPPGQEVAGPATTPLVVELRQAIRAELALLAQVKLREQDRFVSQVVPFQCDASGNATVRLYEVPGSATASLCALVVDEAGVTPQSPDTRATLSLSIYAGSGAAVAVAAVGAMLDCLPQTPGVAAQIPFAFNYGAERTAPRIMGPLAFYLVVQNANANARCAARIGVAIEQPD